MNSTNTFRKYSGRSATGTSTFVRKSNLYSFVIGVVFLSCFGMGNIEGFVQSFRQVFFPIYFSAFQENESNERDCSDILETENNATKGADWITPGTASTGVLNNSNSVTFSHTTGAGTDRLLMVGVSAQQPGHQVTSLTYNGVALTRLGRYTHPSQTRVEIWYLIAPPVGTYNIVLNNSVNENAVIGAQSFADVNQTTPFGTPASSTGNGTLGNASVTAAANEIVFGMVAFNNGDTDIVPGGSQTEYWDATVNSSIAGAASTQAGGGLTTAMYTSTSTNWTAAAVAILPNTCVSPNSPACLLDGIGMSRIYGDADSQNIGDSNSDDQDGDDFISFINFGGTDVDISGWELYVDQNGTGSPVFTFPASTIVSPCEEITVISDWNAGPALPTNWFDANFTGSEGLFEESSNRVAYAILRNPNTNEYISIHHNSSAPTLGTGTMVCDYSFYSFITTDFDACELVYWDAGANAYNVVSDCNIYSAYTACIPMVEICNNGIDDDCDGLIDCADPDCGMTNIVNGCITVNSTGDGADTNPGDGICADSNCECTLRAAIEEANASTGRDTICFNITGGGIQTIALTSMLPTISDTVFIDGTTQTGFSATPLIRVDGDALNASDDLINFGASSDYSELRSLILTRSQERGIHIEANADYIKLAGNWVGT
ncbi:MAG: CSLREA domain-containing protein, partial [Saprospiraceae bacterium]